MTTASHNDKDSEQPLDPATACERLDSTVTYLSAEDFVSFLELVNSPTPPEVQAKIDDLLNYRFPWANRKEEAAEA